MPSRILFMASLPAMAGRLRARLPDRPSRIAALHPGCDGAAPGQFPSATLSGAACRGQGQRSLHTALAMHAQTAFAPVDIGQFESNDLSCTQPEPCQQQQDGSIAQPGRRSPLFARVQKNPYTVGRHRSRNRRHRPSGNGGYSRGKIGMDVVAVPCKAKERPQCRDDVFCRSECAVLRRISPDIVRNLAGMHGSETQFGLAGYVRQKVPYIPGEILGGRRGQNTNYVQARPVFLQYAVNTGRLDRSRGPAFDDAFLLKPVRYAGQSVTVAALETTVLGAVAQERFFMCTRNLINRNALAVQPPTELVDEERFLPIGNLRVPLVGKILGIGLKIRSQRTLDHKPRAPLSTCSAHRNHEVG